MTDDALTTRLVEVARQVVDETPGQQFATARRIHESLEREHRGRKRRIQVIALAFAGICALLVVARYAGWQPDPPPDEPPVAVSAPVRAPGPSPVAPRPPPVAPAPPSPALSPVPAPVAVPAPPSPSPAPLRPVPRPTVVVPVPAKRSTVPAPVRPEMLREATAPTPPATEPVHPADSGTERVERAVPAAPAAPDAPDAEELKSYSRAHDAYFHGADPAAALAAWDAYLASYPSGQLVLEARYARALVLIKLERWTDAAAALRPFASAPAGSYRQAEAARLLAAIPAH